MKIVFSTKVNKRSATRWYCEFAFVSCCHKITKCIIIGNSVRYSEQWFGARGLHFLLFSTILVVNEKNNEFVWNPEVWIVQTIMTLRINEGSIKPDLAFGGAIPQFLRNLRPNACWESTEINFRNADKFNFKSCAFLQHVYIFGCVKPPELDPWISCYCIQYLVNSTRSGLWIIAIWSNVCLIGSFFCCILVQTIANLRMNNWCK